MLGQVTGVRTVLLLLVQLYTGTPNLARNLTPKLRAVDDYVTRESLCLSLSNPDLFLSHDECASFVWNVEHKEAPFNSLRTGRSK